MRGIYYTGGGERDFNAVWIAHVRLQWGSSVSFFSKPELMGMMQTVGESAWDINAAMDRIHGQCTGRIDWGLLHKVLDSLSGVLVCCFHG